MSEPSWELEFVVAEMANGELLADKHEEMRILAADGWELVAVTGTVAYFKRAAMRVKEDIVDVTTSVDTERKYLNVMAARKT